LFERPISAAPRLPLLQGDQLRERSDLDGDFLDHFADDAEAAVIGAYIEASAMGADF
jgi:hypothetical protein